MTHQTRKLVQWLFLFAAAGWQSVAVAASWIEGGFSDRRPIETRTDPGELDSVLACVEFYAPGSDAKDGRDLRVATAGGKLLPMNVLGIGPGDLRRVVFAPVRGETSYYVYFNHPNPPAMPEHLRTLNRAAGLRMEMRAFPGGASDNFETLLKCWNRAEESIGSIYIDRPYLGFNPINDRQQTISKLTGTLTVTDEGEYSIAGACDDRGAVYIDGKPVLFIPGNAGDARFNAKVQLTKGAHDLLVYHLNTGGEFSLSLAWRASGFPKYDVIPISALGKVIYPKAGALERMREPWVPDISGEYVAECFVADRYAHRYKFAATVPKVAEKAVVTWDFGDGTSASGNEVDHVFLGEGVFPIRVTYQLGPKKESQTTAFVVRRDFRFGTEPKSQPPQEFSRVIAKYDLNSIEAGYLPLAIRIHLRGGETREVLRAAESLVKRSRVGNIDEAIDVLREAARTLVERGDGAALAECLGKAPAESPLNPRLAVMRAKLLMWSAGDFAGAVNAIKPHRDTQDESVRRTYGQAIILAGDVAGGRAVLEGLTTEKNPAKRAALSGAAARTVEFFITEREVDAGEEQWERWQAKFPEEFVSGYSVLLRVQLIALREPVAAAKVAEAFAIAVPGSTYAPQLLDTASKLLLKTDPTKSASLKKLLKEKYPENPLAN